MTSAMAYAVLAFLVARELQAAWARTAVWLAAAAAVAAVRTWRLYLGVHWSTDVLGACALAAVLLALLGLLGRRAARPQPAGDPAVAVGPAPAPSWSR